MLTTSRGSLPSVLLGTHVLYPYPYPIIESILSPITPLKLFTNIGGEMAEKADGVEAENLNGSTGVGASGRFAHGDTLEGFDGFGGLLFDDIDHAAASKGFGNAPDNLACAELEMGWDQIDYPGFHPTSGNGSYDSYNAMPRALSTSSPATFEASVNFQPLNNSFLNTNLSTLFDEVPTNCDISMQLMSDFILNAYAAAQSHHESSIIVTTQSNSDGRNSTPKAKYSLNSSMNSKTLSKSIKGFPSIQGPRYHCPTANCTRSYKRQFELIRHQHIHSNIRIHECRFIGCHRNGEGKGFARKDHLKQHLKLVHSASI
ncbi:hypothetical protein VTL71DRAFT_14476 [Oculimacula yallundae]|uniref:C2H2-type domain-containing protein n=1 Tax=Oculimacula yallundae TaxID=86028 RepID=A0ABR4CJW6_9HELO